MKSRVLANTGYRLMADVGGKVGSVVLFIVMGRELGDEAFGVFTFAYALAALLTSFADFGQDKVLTREVARDRDALDSYFLNTLALKAVVALPALGVALAVLAALGRDTQTIAVVALLGAAVLVDLLTSTIFATFQAFERLEFVPVALITERFVTAAAGIALLLLGAGVVAVSAVFLGGALLAFGLAARLLVRRVVRPRPRLEPSRWWSLMWIAAPIGLAGIAAVILFRIDTVMLAAYESDDVVGNYGAAYRLFESTLFLSWAVGAAVLGDRVVGVLYGSDFDLAGKALRLLAPAIVLYAIAYLAGYVLVAQERPLVLTVVYAAVALENILVNLVLIPTHSLYGAAVGTSISEGLAACALVWAARGCGGTARFGRVFAGPALAAAVAGAAMWALRWELWAATVAGAFAYVLTLIAFERLVYPDDAEALLSSVRSRRG